MRKTILVLLLGLALAAFAAAGCGGDDDESGTDTDTTTETETGGTVEPGATLLGSVGPGFEISLTTEDGQDVTTLPAGSYTIQINDQSDMHNFHSDRPGRSIPSTEVSEVGEVTWPLDLGGRLVRVRLRPARELHERQLRGDGLEADLGFGLRRPVECLEGACLRHRVLASEEQGLLAADRVGQVLELETVRVGGVELDSLDLAVAP